MKNLKIWQKLLLLAAVFMLPFVIVTANLLSAVDEQVDFARGELIGMEYVIPLVALSNNLQLHRSLALRASRDPAGKSQLDASSSEVQESLRRIDAIYAGPTGEAYQRKRWETLREGIRDLVLNGRGGSAEAEFNAHGVLVKDVADLIAKVGDVSQLTLDPQEDSYYLMNSLLLQTPELAEYLSRARALGASVTAGQAATPEQIDRLRGLAALSEGAGQRLNASLDKLMQADAAVKSALQSGARAVDLEVRNTRSLVNQVTGSQVESARESSGLGSERTHTAGIADLQAALAPILQGSLKQRMARYKDKLRSSLAWAALAGLTVLVIAFFIVRDITRPLTQVVGVANQVSVGNLNVEPISSDRKDEIGALARAFDRMIMALREQVLLVQDIADGDLTASIKPQSANDDMGNALVEMVEHLSGLVSEVHKSGIQVNTSATQISATAREQHSTASEIAATTTQISATSKEISATSKEMVRTMNEVAEAAEQSANLAGSGQAGLTQMEETMHRVMDATGSINAKLAVLNEKAGNITQVVTTITRVADQTNLLSLNAAIEAEKAGEYGRGFSVVATEIRRLADQTAVATFDIEQMVREIQSAVSAGVMGMDKFSEEVRRGMDEVQQVGAQLSQIIVQVQQMAPRCEAANEGMRAQATGAEQITQALSQLSEAALQTVESLRQSNQAIDGLHQSANGLREGVSRFKLA